MPDLVMVNPKHLETMMQIAHDIKKGFSFNKAFGTWEWFDRDEEHIPEAHHTGFVTFYLALEDAVEPYLDYSE